MKKWQRLMAVAGNCDAVLISSPENRMYFSGFASSDGLVLITHSEAYIVIDFRYITAAKENPEGLKTVLIEKTWHETLLSLVQKLGIKKLGIEEDYVTLDIFKDLKDSLDTEFLFLSDTISSLRMIKSEDEVDTIKKAQAITDKAFSHILAYIKEGVSEADIALELDYFMRKNGAEAPAFDSIVVSGEKSALPHGVPGERKLKGGDFLTMDFGAKFNGYCSDMTRTVAIGSASDEMKRIYDIVLAAQKNALNNIRAGISGVSADAYARDIIEQSGYGKYFGHGTGHGIGLQIHEAPNFSPRCKDIIPENCIVSVEPGIYIEGKFGVRIEDMVIVKKDGVINLTRSDKQLIIV